MTDNLRTIDRLLYWLGVYVVMLFVLAWAAGKPGEAIPVLTNLISGFAGAAFAIMRLGKEQRFERFSKVDKDQK
ncbi:MAG TPA: hypothetical protein VFQ79_24515 [Bryobacteraceae bacterium]|nr:hypothetical protein [Bryobacteraceae bacterium]